VFADGADKGKSSSYIPPKETEVKEEKHISSVGVTPPQKDLNDRNEIAAFESKPVISSKPTESTTEVDHTIKDKPKARAGALDEGELEAEKAAKELFPETT